MGACTGLSGIDSTALAVCHNARIGQHKVFALDARPDKTSVGWFYGLKLPLVVNDRAELLACCLTPGNVDDRWPVPRLVRRLFGKLFGDRGYLSHDLAAALLVVTQGLQLITTLRKHMHNRLLDLSDKLLLLLLLLLRKRAILETSVDQLKTVGQIAHSRHRSPRTFLVNLLAGLIASCQQPEKPSLDLGLPALPAASLFPNSRTST